MWQILRERPVILAAALALLVIGGVLLVSPFGADIRSVIQSIDEAMLMALRSADPADPLGPEFVEEVVRDLTALGGVTITFLLVMTVVAFLVIGGRRRTAVFVVATIVSGLVFSLLLKAGFDRPRPDLVPHGSHVHTASFPSGHAAMAAVVYLTLAAVLTRVLPHRAQRVLAVVLALVVTLAVGFSRVYLGVHWPTDVLAGWLVGGGWAAGAWAVERALQREGDLEAPPATLSD
jgi:undecaprenyl-diphosphatase